MRCLLTAICNDDTHFLSISQLTPIPVNRLNEQQSSLRLSWWYSCMIESDAQWVSLLDAIMTAPPKIRPHSTKTRSQYISHPYQVVPGEGGSDTEGVIKLSSIQTDPVVAVKLEHITFISCCQYYLNEKDKKSLKSPSGRRALELFL